MLGEGDSNTLPNERRLRSGAHVPVARSVLLILAVHLAGGFIYYTRERTTWACSEPFDRMRVVRGPGRRSVPGRVRPVRRVGVCASAETERRHAVLRIHLQLQRGTSCEV